MNRALGHCWAHTGSIGPGEPLEDDKRSDMTLPSRHRIRNLNPGGLRPSTLPHSYGGSPQYCVLRVDGDETLLFLSNRRDRETNKKYSSKNGTLAWKALPPGNLLWYTCWGRPRPIGKRLIAMTPYY